MRCALLSLAACAALFACGEPPPEKQPDSVDAPCTGLALEIRERSVLPPANVAARLAVTDCGRDRPLPFQLEEKDFRLLEDGSVLSSFEAARKITPLTRDASQFTLLVLDLSGSVTRAGVKAAMIDGARKLVRSLDGHRVAIFGFDGRPDLIPYAYFTSDRAEVQRALDAVGESRLVDDSTNLYGAVVNAISVLDDATRTERGDERIAYGSLVLFTDGRDRAGRVPAAEAQSAVARSGHATFVIGLGGELDPAELQKLGTTVIADGEDDLVPAFDQVAERVKAEAQKEYLVSYCTPARAGPHTLTIVVDARRDEASYRGEVELEFDADGFGAGCSPEGVTLR